MDMDELKDIIIVNFFGFAALFLGLIFTFASINNGQIGVGIIFAIPLIFGLIWLKNIISSFIK